MRPMRDLGFSQDSSRKLADRPPCVYTVATCQKELTENRFVRIGCRDCWTFFEEVIGPLGLNFA